MKEVLKVLRDLRIETSERGNYIQSYANGYTDAISDAIQAVKKMDYIPCCKSDSELLSCNHCKGTGKVHYDNGTWQICYTCGGNGTR